MMSVGTDPNFVPKPGAARRTQEMSTGTVTMRTRCRGLVTSEAKPATASSSAQQYSASAELPMP